MQTFPASLKTSKRSSKSNNTLKIRYAIWSTTIFSSSSQELLSSTKTWRRNKVTKPKLFFFFRSLDISQQFIKKTRDNSSPHSEFLNSVKAPNGSEAKADNISAFLSIKKTRKGNFFHVECLEGKRIGWEKIIYE